MNMGKLNKALTVILLVIIIGLIAAIVYLAVTPQPGDRFTEFYILNRDGKASDYPNKMVAGQPAALIIGIVNHEGRAASYRVQVRSGGAIIKTIQTDILQDKQKWENVTDISMNTAGEKQKVEFYLFINDETIPHIKDPLVLFVDVTGAK